MEKQSSYTMFPQAFDDSPPTLVIINLDLSIKEPDVVGALSVLGVCPGCVLNLPEISSYFLSFIKVIVFFDNG